MSRLLSLAVAAATLPLGAFVLSYAPPLPHQHHHQGVRASPTSTAVYMSTTSRTVFATISNKEKIMIEPTWQACVDELLDPITPLARRQALLGKLVNANKDIQESVLTALRDRKVRTLPANIISIGIMPMNIYLTYSLACVPPLRQYYYTTPYTCTLLCSVITRLMGC
jgi:hypothetical protein